MDINIDINISTEVYYDEVEELLDKGDLVQTREKYYKAAEDLIKLLAIQNNLKNIIGTVEKREDRRAKICLKRPSY
ncbi:hypothetical protein IC006_1454 [Sulfuracidifex tepidarius]|uniref:Uncharacterized protein n=1 Tax=Sulfuracidifex tepidarius TaxID=1294262 RepID=A0A510E357_9CREN|nr:PaREP1 family protein [Sulfuracidifex tepidarius]BBG24150.1 hypothetical protein IC006_1454 [Sulfuracidifex tepidarius]BBG26907.1 hypothetical protein IC007_1431 [Sulfuracidifex tepidarius]